MFWILITDILTYPVVRIEVAFWESGPRGYRNSISGKIDLSKKKKKYTHTSLVLLHHFTDENMKLSVTGSELEAKWTATEEDLSTLPLHPGSTTCHESGQQGPWMRAGSCKITVCHSFSAA